MMQQRAYVADDYRVQRQYQPGTMSLSADEYNMLHNPKVRPLNATKTAQPRRKKKYKLKWRFKPKFSGVLLWILLLTMFFKMLLLPLAEGIFGLIASSNKVHAMQAEYEQMNAEYTKMGKSRDYMLTSEYVEERGHQLGMVKENETHMVLVDESGDINLSRYLANRQRKVEIGD